MPQRYYTAPSASFTPNPAIFAGDAQSVTVVEVAEGVRVGWISNAQVSTWRIYRADASLQGPPLLVAILPATARTFLDLKRQNERSYRQGHAHTYSVYATH